MEYYIQGDPARANKIKAAFERLGYDPTGWKFDVESGFFYTHDGRIGLACSKFLINLIKTHPDYKELELPIEPNFKVGDWVVKKNGETFSSGNYAEQITLIEVGGKGKCIWLTSKTWIDDDDIRLWTIKDAEDGDVLVCYSEAKGVPIEQAGIFKQYVGRHGGCSNTFWAHAGIDWDGNILINGYMGSTTILPATQEQHNFLFAKMKEAGYTWDEKKKEPKNILPHYDIDNFHAGMPVLVRDYDNSRWSYVQFSHYVGEECGFKFNACGIPYIQCIPYNEDTKHLLGTTDKPSEEYINW